MTKEQIDALVRAGREAAYLALTEECARHGLPVAGDPTYRHPDGVMIVVGLDVRPAVDAAVLEVIARMGVKGDA